MTDTTMVEFRSLCQKAFNQKRIVEEIEERAKQERKTLNELQLKILDELNNTGMEKFQLPEHGTVYKTTRTSVKTPKSNEDKEKFFNFLKERGIFMDMATVNSQTLNAFYKTEMSRAVEDGDFDFQIPGIGEPVLIEEVRMRKG